MEILLARFQDFKLRVQAGDDKFSTCVNLAKRLESVVKDLSSVDVKEVQAQLTEEWMSLIKRPFRRKTRSLNLPWGFIDSTET